MAGEECDWVVIMGENDSTFRYAQFALLVESPGERCCE